MNTGRAARDYGNTESPRYALTDHRRRLQHVVQTGTIFQVDHKAAHCRVRIGNKDDEDKIETDWVPWHVGMSSNNKEWNPPEVDEQVTLICPSGHLNNAFVIRGVPYDKFQNEASTPDVWKQTFRTDPKKTELDAMIKLNRKSGKYWVRIKKSGGIHLQVGAEAAIVVTDEEIQIKNKDTMLSITKEGIKMFVKKEEATFCMVPDSITAQVKQKGIWKLTDSLFTAAIDTKSYLKLTADTLLAWASDSAMSIRQGYARLLGGASSVQCNDGGIVTDSPTFRANPGSAAPIPNDYSKPDKDDEPKVIAEPPSDQGYKPYRPEN